MSGRFYQTTVCTRCRKTVTSADEGQLMGEAVFWHDQSLNVKPTRENTFPFCVIVATAMEQNPYTYTCLRCSEHEKVVHQYLQQHHQQRQQQQVIDVQTTLKREQIREKIRQFLVQTTNGGECDKTQAMYKMYGVKKKPKRPKRTVGFGKHKRLTYEDLLRKYPDYCDWLLDLETSHAKIIRLQKWLRKQECTH